MKDLSRNLTMLCDFYELTMGNGYFQTGYKDRIVYFDVFFRKVPDGGSTAYPARSSSATAGGCGSAYSRARLAPNCRTKAQ